MSENWGFSVRIFIPTRDPEGLRIIEKPNWTGDEEGQGRLADVEEWNSRRA